jgi:hypothetical protein
LENQCAGSVHRCSLGSLSILCFELDYVRFEILAVIGITVFCDVTPSGLAVVYQQYGDSMPPPNANKVSQDVQLCCFATTVKHDNKMYGELLFVLKPKPPKPRVVCMKIKT